MDKIFLATKRFLHSSKIIHNVVKISPLATLRKVTGYSLANCKKAVALFPDNLNKAEEWLREQAKAEGWDKINKLQTRVTHQGLLGVVSNNHVAAMVEVNCETDFVSKNAKFQELVASASKIVLQQYSSKNLSDDDISKILITKMDLENMKTRDPLVPKLSDMVTANVNLLGENVVLRRGMIIHSNKNNRLISYVHPPLPLCDGVMIGKYGAFVVYRSVKEFPEDSELTLAEVEKNLCQHIIGLNPKGIGSKEDKPLDSKDELKGDNSLENKEPKDDISLENKEPKDDTPLKNEEEHNLLSQEYLSNNEYTVGEYMEEHGIEIIDFVRFECGEPLI